LTENCVESVLQLEMQSIERPENCVLVSVLEPKREESGKLCEHGDGTCWFLKLQGGSLQAEELLGSEGGLCCVG
jgi:hypothetical protein